MTTPIKPTINELETCSRCNGDKMSFDVTCDACNYFEVIPTEGNEGNVILSIETLGYKGERVPYSSRFYKINPYMTTVKIYAHRNEEQTIKEILKDEGLSK